MVEMGENAEATVILVESIFAAASGLIVGLPIPAEIKAPILTFTGAVAAAIFVYWRARINVTKKTEAQ
jgi:hypothetical protein